MHHRSWCKLTLRAANARRQTSFVLEAVGELHAGYNGCLRDDSRKVCCRIALSAWRASELSRRRRTMQSSIFGVLGASGRNTTSPDSAGRIQAELKRQDLPRRSREGRGTDRTAAQFSVQIRWRGTGL
jgi:hypothetical protein